MASLITGIAYVYYWSQGAVILANDGVARLNIARRVFDSLDPGLVQLGGIWPPAPQVAMLPLVWVDPLYHSGLAGSIPSMLAFVGAATYAYLLAKLLTGSRLGGLIAFAVVLLNPNALYLATTPMSEPLLMLTVFASAYHLLAWMRTERLAQLSLTSVWIFLSSLTRYEGWSLALGGGMIVVVYALNRYRSRRRTEALALIFLVPAVYGVILWLLYGTIIYGSPIHFATGDGSAKFYTLSAETYQNLGTKFNVVGSLRTFFGDALDVVGLPFLALAAAALALSIASAAWPRNRDLSSSLIVGYLGLPVLFLIASLFQGQTLILGVHTPVKGLWNTRYGINVLPVVAILCAYPTRWSRYLAPGCLIAVLCAVGMSYAIRGPLMQDTTLTHKTSSTDTRAWSAANYPIASGLQPLALLEAAEQWKQDVSDAASWLHAHYDRGLVLTSAIANDQFIFQSHLPTNAFVFEGTQPYWTDEMKAPGTWARWIVAQPQGTGDKVALNVLPLLRGSPRFTLAFENSQIQIYEVNEPPAQAPAASCANPQLARLAFATNPTVFSGDVYGGDLTLTNNGDRSIDGVLAGLSITQGAQYVSRVDFGNGQPWLVNGSSGTTLYLVGDMAPHQTEHVALHITPSAAWNAASPDAQVRIDARVVDRACQADHGNGTTIVIAHTNAAAPACVSPELADLKFASAQTLSGNGPFDVAAELTNEGDHPFDEVLLGFAVVQGGQYVSRVDFGNGQPWLVNGTAGATLYSAKDVGGRQTRRISLRVTPIAAWADANPDAQIVIEARVVDRACPSAAGDDMKITFVH